MTEWFSVKFIVSHTYYISGIFTLELLSDQKRISSFVSDKNSNLVSSRFDCHTIINTE